MLQTMNYSELIHIAYSHTISPGSFFYKYYTIYINKH